MKNRWLLRSLILLNLVVLSVFIVQYAGATYPSVGHDYRLFATRLLDTHLHYKVEGFSIQWYTPSFGGGLPAYPNPLHMQFSLQQGLTLFFNPWVAILAAAVVYLIIGFVVTFLLLRDCLEFHPLAALLGANFFVASGFFIERVAVGHADKITFPLIVVPIYALLNRRLPAWLAGALIALTAAVLIHSGGVYIGIIFVFMAVVTLPVVFFLKPSLLAWRRALPILAWGSLLSILLCGSKLHAVALYMQNFPRTVQDHYFVNWIESIGGMLLQLGGVMTTLPLLSLIGKSSMTLPARLAHWTGSPWGFWEMDTSISPVLILLLVYGSGVVLFRKPRLEMRGALKKGLAAVILIFAILLVVQFSAARGFLFEALNGLPLLQSVRTNTRFVAAFILPLALLGSKAFDAWLLGRPRKVSGVNGAGTAISVGLLLNGLSLLSLWAYYLLPLDIQVRNFEIPTILSTYEQIEGGDTFPVKQIIPAMNDYEVFQAHASNISQHYDPLLGENSFRPLLHEGSVFDIEDGTYNMTDPTGYVFPEENQSDLFSRIPVSDAEKLTDFLNRRQPDWERSRLQTLLDWASGLTFLALVLALIATPIMAHPRRKKPKAPRSGR